MKKESHNLVFCQIRDGLMEASALERGEICERVPKGDPAAVTKAAIDELPEMERDPEKYKRYRSAGELIAEIVENTPS